MRSKWIEALKATLLTNGVGLGSECQTKREASAGELEFTKPSPGLDSLFSVKDSFVKHSFQIV